MRRTSFVGALTVIALGGALAFGLQKSPKDLDLHLTGVIIMIAGIADLLVRFLIADSPLLSQTTADVAAIVEPLGEPVLDAFGNPIMTAEPAARPPLVAPNPQPTQILPVVVEPSASPVPVAVDTAVRQPDTVLREQLRPNQVVRRVGDHGTDEALVPISPLTGRPVRTRRRRRYR